MTNCCASIGLPAAPSSTVNASIIRSKTIAVVSDHTPILCCNWARIAIKVAQPITVKNLLKRMNDKQMFIASNSIDYKNGRKKTHFFIIWQCTLSSQPYFMITTDVLILNIYC